jgi:hypothetical protein
MQPASPQEQRSTLGRAAIYSFGREREDVEVVAWTRDGLPVIVRRDGSMAVVELHRVQLRRDLP